MIVVNGGPGAGKSSVAAPLAPGPVIQVDTGSRVDVAGLAVEVRRALGIG